MEGDRENKTQDILDEFYSDQKIEMISRIKDNFPTLTNLQTEIVTNFFDKQARDQNQLLSFVGAPTGVGKTLCYLLCSFGSLKIEEDSVVVENRSSTQARGKEAQTNEVTIFKPQVVICIETQSLIEQVYDEINKLIPPGKDDPYSKLRARKLFKGERMENWLDEDKKAGRCDILISSPHLLESLSKKVDMSGKVIDFSNVKLFILDEAESVWENDKERIKNISERIIKNNRNAQQLCYMFVSATLDKKTRTEVMELINKIRNQIKLAAVVSKYYQLKLQMTVHQRYVEVDDRNKLDETFRILRDVLIENRNDTQVMIFLPTQKRVEEYVDEINKNEIFKKSGIISIGYHGKLENKQQNLNNFRKGDYKVLCCTEVLARGIDIPGVGLVVIPQVPRETEFVDGKHISKDIDPVTYMHMVGRTGRFTLKGTSIVFYSKQDKKGNYNNDQDLERELHRTIMELAQKDTDVPLPENIRSADSATQNAYIKKQKESKTEEYIKELNSQGYLSIKNLDIKEFVPTLKSVLDYNKKIIETNKVNDQVVTEEQKQTDKNQK